MKYRAFAKHFLYDRGAQAVPTHEDAEWLTGGQQKLFTEKQLYHLIDAFNKERGRVYDGLVRQGILLDGCLIERK